MKAKRTAKAAFDLKGFLTKTEVGRTPVDYAEKAVIFAQGDPAKSGLLHPKRQGQTLRRLVQRK